MEQFAGIECSLELSDIKVFSTAYLAPIQWYAELISEEEVIIEACEHFRKQSYRNRALIAGPQGVQKLVIPVKKRNHSPVSEVKLANEFSWQKEHLRSLQAAYRNSAYFEFYEHHFIELYEARFESLLDLNEAFHLKISALLNIDVQFSYTKEYNESPKVDLRNRIHPKLENNDWIFPRYPQVFIERQGFLPNLSIIDLLFNLGPESPGYLKNCQRT
jgi:hypothetical protein